MKTRRRYGRLTVVKSIGGRTVLCLCTCGTIKEVDLYALKGGRTRSCGCLSRELSRKRRTQLTHGFSRTPEYRAWVGMIQRCTNPNDVNFHNYGSRGITVHPAWEQDFVLFLEEVGLRPSNHHSIDRIDNAQGYKPGNVRWANAKEQSRNTRVNRHLTHMGKTQCLASWAEELGIKKKTLHMRLSKGWSAERALTQPVQPQRH